MAQTINLGRVAGKDGAPGPNEVSTETTTPLDGILVADGANVNAVPTLPVEKGGTGADNAVDALRNLGARSNPNLLDNWDFRNPVNPDEKISVSTKVSLIPGWYISGGYGTASISRDGLTLSANEEYEFQISQRWFDYRNLYDFTTVTVSILLPSGNIEIRNFEHRDEPFVNLAFADGDLIVVIHFDAKYAVLRANYNATITISAIKIEPGPVSTLALDLDQPNDLRAQAIRLTGRTGGMDLSRVMTAEDLHEQITFGDYSNIHTGDYWPIVLNGSFKDYADGTTKTLSNAVVNLEFMPNFYANYGDTTLGNHCLVCSRDCLPIGLKMRSANDVWYDSNATNPFLGSHLYQTLNASDGIISLVEQTELGSYIGNMRFLMEIKAAGATAATSWAWSDRGKLFLPTEREVWGQDVWSEHSYGGGGNSLQWPIFAGSRRHIIKGLGNGGSRYTWWCSSSAAGSAVHACSVDFGGRAGDPAISTALGVPLCFIII